MRTWDKQLWRIRKHKYEIDTLLQSESESRYTVKYVLCFKSTTMSRTFIHDIFNAPDMDIFVSSYICFLTYKIVSIYIIFYMEMFLT